MSAVFNDPSEHIREANDMLSRIGYAENICQGTTNIDTNLALAAIAHIMMANFKMEHRGVADKAGRL